MSDNPVLMLFLPVALAVVMAGLGLHLTLADFRRVLAAPNVIDLFLDEESQSLAMLSDFIGKKISLHAEGSYTQEQFDIVLL